MELTRLYAPPVTTEPPAVLDLADPSRARPARRRGVDLGGPIAAALGGVALSAAAAPGLPVDARWCLVVGAGLVALPVAFSALRRRQALITLLLAVFGLLTPLAAGAVAVQVTVSATSTVSSATVPDAALADHDDGLQSTRPFDALPLARRTDVEAFTRSLALRLLTLHGTTGPYPASLRLTAGSVVEGAGPLRGTTLGVVPAGARLEYAVTTSGTAFRLTVVEAGDEHASVSAGSSLDMSGGG